MNGGDDAMPVTNGGWLCGGGMTLGPIVVLLVGSKLSLVALWGLFVVSLWWFGRMVVEGCSQYC